MHNTTISTSAKDSLPVKPDNIRLIHAISNLILHSKNKKLADWAHQVVLDSPLADDYRSCGWAVHRHMEARFNRRAEGPGYVRKTFETARAEMGLPEVF